jgi:hypothetical protein
MHLQLEAETRVDLVALGNKTERDTEHNEGCIFNRGRDKGWVRQHWGTEQKEVTKQGRGRVL